MINRAIIFIFLASLTGCDQVTSLFEGENILVVSVSNEKHIPETRKILLSRFEDYSPSFLSSISTEVDSNKIIFSFKRGSPSKEIIEILTSTQGNLTARSPEGIWFTEKDIVEIIVKKDKYERNTLVFTLTNDGGARVKQLSKKAVNNKSVIDTYLDDEVLASANVLEPLVRKFQLSFNDVNAYRLGSMACTLRHGALPEKVSIIKSSF